MIAHPEVLAIIAVVAALLFVVHRLRSNSVSAAQRKWDGEAGGGDAGFMFSNDCGEGGSGDGGGGDGGGD